MSHFAVNWVAVVLAMVVSMVIGTGWYMGLSRQWIAATGRTREQIMADASGAAPHLWAAACQLVIAYFIALLTPLLMGETTVLGGIIIGAHMWLGFIVTSMLLNHRYEGRSWALFFINAGYLLLTTVAQGAVIGFFGTA